MSYPFEINKYEHRVYSKTFLQNTTLELTYSSLLEEKECKDFPFALLHSYIDKFFHLQLQPEPNMGNGFSLDNKVNDITLSFKKDAVGIRVGRRNYQSFASSVMPYLYLLKSYVKDVMGLDAVESIIVRKINLWPFPTDIIDEQRITEDALYSAVFRPVFLQVDTETTMINGQKFLSVRYDEKEISLSLSRSLKEEDSHKVIVLDSKATSQQTTPTNINDIEIKLEELNNILFASYHWCVSDEIIKIMEDVE